jgi:outer membrane lipopolysaccharide assembly protein LptE/RlpB
MLTGEQMRNAEFGIRNLVRSADGIARRFRNPQSEIRNYIKVLFILCVVLITGCGYQLAGKETHVPPGLNSIAIPTFKNQTFEPGIEIQFTQAFLNEFIQDRRVNVVSREEADCSLEGVVTDFRTYAVAYDKSGFVLQYQIGIVVDVTLKDRAGKVLWEQKGLNEVQWFRASSVGVTNEAAKQAAIQKTAGLMADRIRSRFFYNF